MAKFRLLFFLKFSIFLVKFSVHSQVLEHMVGRSFPTLNRKFHQCYSSVSRLFVFTLCLSSEMDRSIKTDISCTHL